MAHQSWSVTELKKNLSSRGAKTSGKKEELIERLESYMRNDDFKGELITLPETTLPNWPKSGFRQLGEVHQIDMPPVSEPFIKAYFQYRMCLDHQENKDIKALEKGTLMKDSMRVSACSFIINEGCTYFTGIVRAHMKKKVSYNYKLKVASQGEIMNSECECPVGKGPNATCKHIAAILYALVDFVASGRIFVDKSCTESLQTFHKPNQYFTGSPLKVESVIRNKFCSDILADPRPKEYRGTSYFQHRVQSDLINYSFQTGEDMMLRHVGLPANLAIATLDHDYLLRPFTEYWIDRSLQVCEKKTQEIQMATRQQSSSSRWYEERSWRLTASIFGDIISCTERRDIQKFCKTIVEPYDLKTPAVIHGKQMEKVAIQKFQNDYKMKVEDVGLCVSIDRPYLAASPDGLIGEHSVLEVKCPYNGKNDKIVQGKLFPFLNDERKLKVSHKYYAQVQGQMYVTKREKCYFVVYTFAEMLVISIPYNHIYVNTVLLPKLDEFYNSHFRSYLSKHLL